MSSVRERRPSGCVATMDILRTQSADLDFHRSRRMFCIKDGKTKIAPEGTTMSHLEWFEAEGWITKGNVDEFMDATIRGYFFLQGTRCSSTKGRGSSLTMLS